MIDLLECTFNYGHHLADGSAGPIHNFLLRTVRVADLQRATGIRMLPLRALRSRLWDLVVASITVLGSDVYFDPSYAHWWSSTSCCEQHAARPHSEYT